MRKVELEKLYDWSFERARDCCSGCSRVYGCGSYQRGAYLYFKMSLVSAFCSLGNGKCRRCWRLRFVGSKKFLVTLWIIIDLER